MPTGSQESCKPDAALQIWKALVWGRWSMVDWFDSDDRRFVLALPNSPSISDPRGLSEREREVVAYAVLGESGKVIGGRLALSKILPTLPQTHGEHGQFKGLVCAASNST